LHIREVIKGVFLTGEKFYATINCKNFYQDQNTPQTLSL
jgi:hypothetical protein